MGSQVVTTAKIVLSTKLAEERFGSFVVQTKATVFSMVANTSLQIVKVSGSRYTYVLM
jgi:hypothetical protein